FGMLGLRVLIEAIARVGVLPRQGIASLGRAPLPVDQPGIITTSGSLDGYDSLSDCELFKTHSTTFAAAHRVFKYGHPRARRVTASAAVVARPGERMQRVDDTV